jgi:hypothetical protein
VAAPSPPSRTDEVVDGLLIPAQFSFARLLASPRFALFARLLQQPDAESADFAEIVDNIEALLAGTYAEGDGTQALACRGGCRPAAVGAGRQQR